MDSESPVQLPPLTDPEAFRAWRTDPALWQPAVADIARSHRLPHDAMQAFRTGTNLVVALEDRLILKLFPPMFRSQFVSERTTLRQLAGHLDLPIPEIVLEGERDQWPYLVITRLDGILGTQAWPQLADDQKERVLHHIGETIAQVQRAPLGELAGIEPDWPTFLARQMAGCRARHERLGLPQKYLAELDDLVAQAPALIPMHTPPVILIGEFIPENLLLGQHADGWQLAGLFDFGDVMTGWGEYDLLGPTSFMTAGKPARLHSLLRGYGYGPADINAALTRRLMILTLLHRASDLVRQLCIPDWQDKARTLGELERLLWPL